MVNIGDRVHVPSTKVGQEPRDGVVIGVSGELLRVKWSSGQESMVASSVGAITIIGKAKAPERGRLKATAMPNKAAKKTAGVAAPAKSAKSAEPTAKRAAKAPKPAG